MATIPVPSANGHSPKQGRAIRETKEQRQAVERRLKNLSTLFSMIEPIPDEWRVGAEDKREVSATMVQLADVQPETVEFLWPDVIPLGKITLPVGVPGLGKSLITLFVASRTSTGKPWPSNPFKSHEPGGVVLVGCEDGLEDTVVPRLIAAGADLTRINALVGAQYRKKGGSPEEVSLDLSKHLPAFEHAVVSTPNCKLLILDPITAYMGGTDSHKNAEVRGVMAKLADMAARHKIAVLAISHLNKDEAKAAIHRTSGSTGFVAVAGSVWCVVQDREDESGKRRLFLPIKNNLAADPSGFAFRIEKRSPDDAAPVVKWEMERVKTRIDEAMGTVKRKGPEPTERNEATDWLKASLAAGPRLAYELFREAKAAGIADGTLKRAKPKLGLSVRDGTVYRSPKDGPWWWKLPTPASAEEAEALVSSPPSTISASSASSAPTETKPKARGARSARGARNPREAGSASKGRTKRGANSGASKGANEPRPPDSGGSAPR